MKPIVVWEAFVLIQFSVSTRIFGNVFPLCLLVLLRNGVTAFINRRNKMESFHKSCLLRGEAGVCCLSDAIPATLKKINYIRLLVDIVQGSCLFLAHSQNSDRNYYCRLVCPYAWNNSAPNGRIVMNFDI